MHLLEWRMWKQCRVSNLLLADDAVLIADGEERMQRIVNEMEIVY